MGALSKSTNMADGAQDAEERCVENVLFIAHLEEQGQNTVTMKHRQVIAVNWWGWQNGALFPKGKKLTRVSVHSTSGSVLTTQPGTGTATAD